MRPQQSAKEIRPGTTHSLRERFAYALLGLAFGILLVSLVCLAAGLFLFHILAGPAVPPWFYIAIGVAVLLCLSLTVWGFIGAARMGEQLNGWWVRAWIWIDNLFDSHQ